MCTPFKIYVEKTNLNWLFSHSSVMNYLLSQMSGGNDIFSIYIIVIMTDYSLDFL